MGWAQAIVKKQEDLGLWGMGGARQGGLIVSCPICAGGAASRGYADQEWAAKQRAGHGLPLSGCCQRNHIVGTNFRSLNSRDIYARSINNTRVFAALAQTRLPQYQPGLPVMTLARIDIYNWYTHASSGVLVGTACLIETLQSCCKDNLMGLHLCCPCTRAAMQKRPGSSAFQPNLQHATAWAPSTSGAAALQVVEAEDQGLFCSSYSSSLLLLRSYL